MDKYWKDIDFESSLRLPTGIVLYETLTAFLGYYEECDHVAIAEEFAETRVVGFLDQNDVLHVLLAGDVEMEDLVAFFGDAVGEFNADRDWEAIFGSGTIFEKSPFCGQVAAAAWGLGSQVWDSLE